MKKTGKLSLLLVLALALSLGLATSIWAQSMGKGMGHGSEMMNLTPDQAGKIFDLKEKMHADTAGLRKQMMVKHAELAALWKMEKPDKTAIQAKQKELNALRDQMQEKMTACRLEAKKIAPDFNMGMGMGMGGMGMGHGPGMGMGPGGKGMGPGAGTPPPPPAKGAGPPPPPPPPAK
ncbi:MAG: periplasmic heavy metal sensor [Deltaproteobacteria bacterium]|nr:periplasmic heavy metal sensor [Deltaproteobacteria bacterium]